MNRQFIVKMMQAKQLEYEAIKEVIPSVLKDGLDRAEDELMEIAKEYFLSTYFRNNNRTSVNDDFSCYSSKNEHPNHMENEYKYENKNSYSKNSHNNCNDNKNNNNRAENTKPHTKTKKINIE